MNLINNYLRVGLLATLFLSPGLVQCSHAGPKVEQKRTVEPFTGIKVGGAFNVILNQTGKHKLVIEAAEELLDNITTEVKGDVLHIEMKWDWSWKDHDDITVYVDFKDLAFLNVSGAGNVKANSSLRVNDLDLRVSGAGDVDLEVIAEKMDVEVSGAGDLDLSGSTDSQEIRLSGAGNYDAQDLKSNYTYAKATGAGSIVVFATEEIEAHASGAGSIKYYGQPEKEKSIASGAGNISKK